MNLNDSVQSVAYKLGNRPDLLQQAGQVVFTIQSVVVNQPGSGTYQLGDIVAVNQGGATGGFIQVATMDANGNPSDLAVLSGGSGYQDAQGLSTTGGAGTGLTVNVTTVSRQGPSRIDQWLRAAYINLMMENRFPGTEGTYTFILQRGKGAYPYPDWVRAVERLTLYKPDGTVLTLETKDIGYIRRMNAVTQSAPSMWCEFGKTIVFRPMPDGNGPYTCYLDVWTNPIVAVPIGSTLNLLPSDWVEALEYSASSRGHTDLQEEDKAHAIQSLLYGYMDPQTGKYTPGLIQNLQNRIQASAPHKDYGMQPKGTMIPFTRR
jgi:hypothetical protein